MQRKRLFLRVCCKILGSLISPVKSKERMGGRGGQFVTLFIISCSSSPAQVAQYIKFEMPILRSFIQKLEEEEDREVKKLKHKYVGQGAPRGGCREGRTFLGGLLGSQKIHLCSPASRVWGLRYSRVFLAGWALENPLFLVLCLPRYSILRLMIEQRLEEISEGPTAM